MKVAGETWQKMPALIYNPGLRTGSSLTIVLARNYVIVNLWDLAPSCIHVMCKLTDQILIPVIFKKL